MPDIRDELSVCAEPRRSCAPGPDPKQKPLPKRFYKQAKRRTGDDGEYAVLSTEVSTHTAKTGAHRTLPKSSQRCWQAEWDAQTEIIDPSADAVTRIVNTAIDGVALDDRAVFRRYVRFVGSDLLCYRGRQPGKNSSLAERTLESDNRLDRRDARRPVHSRGRRDPSGTTGGGGSRLCRGPARLATPLGLACLHTVTSLTGSALLALCPRHGQALRRTGMGCRSCRRGWQNRTVGTDEEAFRRRENRWREMLAAAVVLDALK